MNSLMKTLFLRNAHEHLSPQPSTGIDSPTQKHKSALDVTSFHREVNDYLAHYPATRHVDIYLNDVNGAFRGKRIMVNELHSLHHGCYFPQSVYSIDWEGKVLSKTACDLMNSEPDKWCLPVPGTLRPSAHGPQENAQMLLTMKEDATRPYALEPRAILQRVVSRLHDHGLFPVVAPELEFYLIDPSLPAMRGRGSFHMAFPSTYSAIIEAIERTAEAQHLPLSGIVSESEPGQFELNLRHTSDVVGICENVLALRRITSVVAEDLGCKASFMAKPYAELAGNGMHFHISLNDIHKNNVFASEPAELTEMMQLTMAGLLHMMPASMAIMAPHVNSYRRLRKNLTEPLMNSWGYNTRTAALRIPYSSENNRRIEYRLAGADANPYLVMATILAGILYGLEKIDDGDLPEALQHTPELPLFQKEALREFHSSQWLAQTLGETFAHQWTDSKLAELTWFESQVTNQESVIAD